MKQIYVGIDVAKDSFVVAYKENETIFKKATFVNDKKGITQFMKSIDQSCWCILEATGSYSMQLSLTLHQHGRMVSVINPLQVKRFAQTKLKRTKTDSVDSELIAEYGQRMQPVLYEPPDEYIRNLQQLRASYKLLIKTKRAYTNQLHALRFVKDVSKASIKVCKSILKSLDKQIADIDAEMSECVKTHCNGLFRQLQTIPGISKKTAIELITVSNAFKNFYSAKQFSAFIGICPCINESGISIRGYKGISRVGDKQIRATLYMCAMMAKVCNHACRDLYDRLVAAGKPKKVALVAVINKLLKQVFGMLRSGQAYSSDFEKMAC